MEGFNTNQEKGVQKLEEVLPFLKPTEEEIDYNNKFKEAVDLMSSGKLDASIAASMKLRQIKKPDREFDAKQEKTFVESRGNIVKGLGYKIIDNEDKFLILEKDGYRIQIKHFMLPSGSGINNGRISEIEIGKGKQYSTWDNGWDKEPKDESVKKIFKELVDYIN